VVDRKLEFRPQPPPRPPEAHAETSLHDDAVTIHAALVLAVDKLTDALAALEAARDLAVNHSLVPAQNRAEVDAAYNRLQLDTAAVTAAADAVQLVIDYRLGSNNVCEKCGAGTANPDERPWHYDGCPLAADD
jgi:hypothetical protein